MLSTTLLAAQKRTRGGDLYENAVQISDFFLN